MTIIYCAHFWLNGEDRTVKADSPVALRLAIFGKAYAPAHDKVMYWQEEKESTL
jgi:hypothetical protein